MGNKPLITVGIVTRNRRTQLREAISSVYRQNYPEVEIVVVDNASGDGTAGMLRAEYPEIRLLLLDQNLGCPGGRSRLYRQARGDLIVNLDDDGLLEKETLSRLANVFSADPKIGVVAMRMLEPGSAPVVPPEENWRETGLFWGGVSAFRKAMLEETGLYPEDFFFFKEEEFLALKALDAGWKIVYHPGIVIRHPPFKHRPGEDVSRDYYLFRNPLFVVIELFPGFYLWKYLFLRLASYFLVSLRRGSFPAYCRAVGAVPGKLARTLPRRRPVSSATLRLYLSLRGNLPEE